MPGTSPKPPMWSGWKCERKMSAHARGVQLREPRRDALRLRQFEWHQTPVDPRVPAVRLFEGASVAGVEQDNAQTRMRIAAIIAGKPATANGQRPCAMPGEARTTTPWPFSGNNNYSQSSSHSLATNNN